MKKTIFFALLSALSMCTLGQKRDSLMHREVERMVLRLDSMERSDSVRRSDLQKEIGILRGTHRDKLVVRLMAMEKEDSIERVKRQLQLTTMRTSAKGSPVAPFGDTLFFIYTGVGSFKASDRAAAISNKIEKLYNDYEFKADSLRVNTGISSPEIDYHDITVMSINELEAMWFGKTSENLARQYCLIIRKAIQSQRELNTLRNTLIRIGAVLLIFIAVYFLIKIINIFFRKIKRKITTKKYSILDGIKIRGYEVLDRKRELRLILFGANIFRIAIIVIALYLALPLMFGIFPWTQGISETLIAWILTPLKRIAHTLLNYLPNLFTIIVIGGVTHYVIKLLKFVAEEIEKENLRIPGFYPDWSKPTLNIVKFLIYAFSFIIIFPYLPGSESPIFQGVSVFVGILFSLGSSSAIANAVAGLVITYMRPFKIGDRVKIGELMGDVLEKSLLVTRIRTIKNENITIPNASILSGHTINYTTSANEVGLILHTSVTIGYDASWKQVHALLITAASATQGVLQKDGQKPFVLQTSLDDFYVSYQINAYTDQVHLMASIYSELHQNIQDKFNEAGVEIMSPHYRSARDGNATAMPPSYLPSDYISPAFNIAMRDKPDAKNEK